MRPWSQGISECDFGYVIKDFQVIFTCFDMNESCGNFSDTVELVLRPDHARMLYSSMQVA